MQHSRSDARPLDVLTRSPSASLTALCVALGLLVPSLAPAADDAEIARLQAQIERRNATIDELLRRVSTLEQKLGDSGARAPAPPVPPPPPAPAAEAAPAPSAKSASSRTASAEPGAVEVDKVAAERALERTLTAEGALLLEPWSYEIEPYVSYTRTQSSVARLVGDDFGIGIRDADFRRNEVNLGVQGRLGLPFDAQLELDLPYRFVNNSVVEPVGFTGIEKQAQNANTWGDIEVGIAKGLLREKGWIPDLIGRVNWDSASGRQVVGDLALGQGFNELRVSLTALKRQDPLAFVANIGYEKSFERDNVLPGDTYSMYLGVSLAASPETALSFGLSQSFSQETAYDGRDLPGSDQVSSTFTVGASSILTRNVLLYLSAGIGLTEDAPDYSFNLSVPIRF